MSFCPQCGVELVAGARFCQVCGRPLSNEAPDTSPADTPRTASAPTSRTPSASTSRPPSATPTRPQIEVTQESALRVARDGAGLVGGLFVTCFMLVALALLIAAHGTSFGDWLHVAGWLTGMTFRGHLTSSADTSLGPLSLGGGFSFALQPGLPFVCAIAFVVWRSWHDEAQHPSPSHATLIAHTAIIAGAAAVLEAVLAAVLTGTSSFSSGGEQFQSSASLGVSVASALLGTFIYVWLAAAAGRLACAWNRDGVPRRWATLLTRALPVSRQLARFVGVALVPVLVLGVIGLVADGTPIGTWMLILLMLPSVLAGALLFCAGAGLSVGASIGVGSVGKTYGILSGGVPAWTLALLLIPLGALVLVGARAARDDVPAEPPWPDALRGAAIACVCTVAVAFITSITGSASASVIGGSFRLGIDWGTGIVVALLWGAAVPVASYFVPRILGQPAAASVDSFAAGLVGGLKNLRGGAAASTLVARTAQSPAVAPVAPPTQQAAPSTQQAAPSTQQAAPSTQQVVQPTEETAPPTEETATPPPPVAPRPQFPLPPIETSTQANRTRPAPEAGIPTPLPPEDAVVRCPHCRHENLAGSSFCGLCGRNLAPGGAGSSGPDRRRLGIAAGVLAAVVAGALGVLLGTGAFSKAHAHHGGQGTSGSSSSTPNSTTSMTSTTSTTTASTTSTSTTTPKPPPPPTPEAVIHRHLDDLGAGRYQQAFGLISAAYRAHNPSWPSERASASPAIKIISVGAATISSGAADVKIDFYARDHNPTSGSDTKCREFTGTVNLIKAHGQWRYNPDANHLAATVQPDSDPHCPA